MKPKYAWCITHNHLKDEDCEIIGPEKAPARLLSMVGKRFKLYDEEGELYFSGSLHGQYTGHEPIDDFGQPQYGCTEIRFDDEI